MFTFASSEKEFPDLKTKGVLYRPTLKVRVVFPGAYFGKLTYEIRSEAAVGLISMVLEPPLRNAPKQIIVRFRHPEAKLIKAVAVNGAGSEDFDPVKGDIRLPRVTRSRTEIVASY